MQLTEFSGVVPEFLCSTVEGLAGGSAIIWIHCTRASVSLPRFVESQIQSREDESGVSRLSFEYSFPSSIFTHLLFASVLAL